MGIMSASGSFTRYRVLEEVSKELWLQIQDRLVQNSFEEIDDTADEFSCGWVSIEDMLDSAWNSGTPFKGESRRLYLKNITR
jgi:hypothetical protein